MSRAMRRALRAAQSRFVNSVLRTWSLRYGRQQARSLPDRAGLCLAHERFRSLAGGKRADKSTADARRERAMTLAPADFLWTLESLARLHRVPVDATLLAQQFPPPHVHETLVRAVENLGLRMQRVAVDPTKAERIAFPCLAFLRADPAYEDGRALPAILVAVEGGRLLYFTAGSDTPCTVAFTEWTRVFEGHAFLVARA